MGMSDVSVTGSWIRFQRYYLKGVVSRDASLIPKPGKLVYLQLDREWPQIHTFKPDGIGPHIK